MMKLQFCLSFLLFLCFNIVSAQNQELIAKYQDSVKAYYKDFIIKGYASDTDSLSIQQDNYKVDFRGSKMRIEYDDHRFRIGNEFQRTKYEVDLKNVRRIDRVITGSAFDERKKYKIMAIAMLKDETNEFGNEVEVLSSDNKDWSFYSVCIEDLSIYRYLMKLIWEYSN